MLFALAISQNNAAVVFLVIGVLAMAGFLSLLIYKRLRKVAINKEAPSSATNPNYVSMDQLRTLNRSVGVVESASGFQTDSLTPPTPMSPESMLSMSWRNSTITQVLRDLEDRRAPDDTRPFV